jgi:hypothetical protein
MKKFLVLFGLILTMSVGALDKTRFNQLVDRASMYSTQYASMLQNLSEDLTDFEENSEANRLWRIVYSKISDIVRLQHNVSMEKTKNGKRQAEELLKKGVEAFEAARKEFENYIKSK